MNSLVSAGTAFLACGVEAVEAATIVLAVSFTHGVRTALAATLAALATLGLVVATGATLLVRTTAIGWVELCAGIAAAYLGITWSQKGFLRFAGRKPMHDESAAYARHVAQLRGHGGARTGFFTAFSGVFVEGVEVAIVLMSIAASARATFAWALAGAGAAVACVTVAALVLRGPLTRVPENFVKTAVGLILSVLGLLWIVEGLRALL